MTVKLNTALRNGIVDATIGMISAAYSGVVSIYTGAAPANANTAASGTLLVSITLAGGHGAAVAGQATLVASETGVAVATGTAGWARWTANFDTWRVDGSVGTSGTDFIISNTTITSGGTVTLTACTLSQPES